MGVAGGRPRLEAAEHGGVPGTFAPGPRQFQPGHQRQAGVCQWDSRDLQQCPRWWVSRSSWAAFFCPKRAHSRNHVVILTHKLWVKLGSNPQHRRHHSTHGWRPLHGRRSAAPRHLRSSGSATHGPPGLQAGTGQPRLPLAPWSWAVLSWGVALQAGAAEHGLRHRPHRAGL